MPNSSNQFPHLSLRLVKEGIAAPPSGGGGVSATTAANRGDAWGHSSKLKSSVDLITTNWKEEKKRREEEGKPELPEVVSFILRVDPDLFDADALKSFEIEVVADVEQGYIIGASADTELSELREKIEQFINSQRGGGKVPEIWEILEGTQRPEYILSDGLKAEWNQILEQQEYIVDIGVSCINIQEQYPRCPKRKESESNEKYQKRVHKWLNKHNLSLEDWDNLYSERTDDLQKFINQYNGEILRNISGDEIGTSRLPDSFSCRIRILGKGLKDLVLNFPYIFDVSEPDEFSTPTVTPNQSESDREVFTLESPSPDAPRVCVIDSGIQERHPKLRDAIDSQHSRSWVPGELNMTADYVPGGGHGTRVAGAILYPLGISQSDPQKAICWIQNARILDCDNYLPKDLFPPEVLEEIVQFYYHRTKTRIFNHSVAGISPPESVCPELVRSTRNGGEAVSADAVGTSFAAPKVAHIAAALAAAFPQESALFYRALIVQSARLPNWTNESVERLYQGIRTMGYGIPNLDRALGNSANRVTLTTREDERICARQAKVYQVQIPEALLRQGEGFDILIEITLSYVAEPRRTRRHRRKYLSTWLDWTCSKKGEDPQKFLDRVLKEYNEAPQDADEGEGLFRWTLGKKQFRPNGDDQRRPRGIDGIVKEISRSAGTVQKDWAKVQSYDLREGFCIAVVGHEGWNKDSEATVPYSLVVSFETVNSEIAIYEAFVQVQQPLQVQQEIQMTVSS